MDVAVDATRTVRIIKSDVAKDDSSAVKAVMDAIDDTASDTAYNAIRSAVKAVADAAYYAYASYKDRSVINAAYVAKSAADAAGVVEWRLFERLIVNDLERINAGDEHFDHDLSIYKSQRNGDDIWNNFITALRNEECDYWADLYTDIFESGFRIDKEKLKRRLNVREEIAAQGAAAVVKHLENAETQGTV